MGLSVSSNKYFIHHLYDFIFQKLFGRTYSTEEDAKRFQLFSENVKFVNEQNAKYQRGESTWGAATNDFSDKTEHEKNQLHGHFVPTPA